MGGLFIISKSVPSSVILRSVSDEGSRAGFRIYKGARKDRGISHQSEDWFEMTEGCLRTGSG